MPIGERGVRQRPKVLSRLQLGGVGWQEEQVTLARMMLERAAAQPGAPAQRAGAQPPERSTWEALYGIASSGQQPPSDEQVAQWLYEHRMEKYGG